VVFTEQQPKHGDTILHCGHLVRGMHWFKFAGGAIKFTRPDKTRGEAEWFAACDRCYAKHGEKVASFVKGDGVWTGDEPAIQKVEEN
jgi:hypothetical protein